jgi:hypothetical protein
VIVVVDVDAELLFLQRKENKLTKIAFLLFWHRIRQNVLKFQRLKLNVCTVKVLNFVITVYLVDFVARIRFLRLFCQLCTSLLVSFLHFSSFFSFSTTPHTSHTTFSHSLLPMSTNTTQRIGLVFLHDAGSSGSDISSFFSSIPLESFGDKSFNEVCDILGVQMCTPTAQVRSSTDDDIDPSLFWEWFAVSPDWKIMGLENAQPEDRQSIDLSKQQVADSHFFYTSVC